MRDSMPTILFALLIAFVITLVFDWGMDYMGIRATGGDVVGSINGREITYREFSDLLRDYTENQKARTGNDLDERQLKQARDQVWQSLVNRELVDEEIRRIGITVSDDELVEWVRGENPPEDLRQSFVDSTGQFRRDLYEQFLSDPNQFLQDPEGVDPAFGTRWLADYERSLRSRRAQEKLQSIVAASVLVNEDEVRRKFQDQTVQYEFAYALFEAHRLIPDSIVEVTDGDIREYYNVHLDQQKVEASRKLEYVSFPEVPSEEDSAEVKSQMDDIAAQARRGEDFFSLVYTHDEQPDSGSFFNRGELTPGIEAAAFSAKTGDIVGPLLEPDGYHLLKVLAEKKSDRESVHASHILFLIQGAADTNQVLATARDVANRARAGESFADLAQQYSGDPGSAQRGGDLGWFSKGRMVKPFEDAVFSTAIGRIAGPIRTQFGWHVIQVHARESRQVHVVDLLIPIQPSSQTKNNIFDRAVDFAFNARENDFAREAQSLGLEVREAVARGKSATIAGLGTSEAAVRWAFDNGTGEVSDPFNIANSYVVFSITEAKEAGIRPFDEAKEVLRPAVLRTKKVKQAVAMAAGICSTLAPGDSLGAIRAIRDDVTVQKVGPITLNASIPGIGRDQNVMGALSGLTPGRISNPVESTRGAFLIQLLNRSEFDSTAYREQRGSLVAQMLQERKGRIFNEWLNKLKETADIEDNRDVFFR
jgi:parvulin-like peptidyl-prolyl isomerase